MVLPFGGFSFFCCESKIVFIRNDVVRLSSKKCWPRARIGAIAFHLKGQMGPKGYKPRCPSRICKGGHQSKLYRIKGNPTWLNREGWAKKKEGEILCRCAYCGFVWFQESSKKLGLDAKPIGYYDDSEHPWEFISLRRPYRIREQNRSRYWYDMERKVLRAPTWGGVD